MATCTKTVACAAPVNHHNADTRAAGHQLASSAHRPARPLATTTTHATTWWRSRANRAADQAGPKRSGLQVDDGAGERAGDAVDELDVADDHLPQLVHAVGLGLGDDVVGTGDVVGRDDAG